MQTPCAKAQETVQILMDFTLERLICAPLMVPPTLSRPICTPNRRVAWLRPSAICEPRTSPAAMLAPSVTCVPSRPRDCSNSRKMVSRAKSLVQLLNYPVDFGLQDATDLDFADNVFDGAIFGFNGLMQIPGSASRRKAMGEVFRVLRPGSWFVFTAHDRTASENPKFWKAETRSSASKMPSGHSSTAPAWGTTTRSAPPTATARIAAG